jgi:oxygen-independent coproporphyrinogen-3 oxidase
VNDPSEALEDLRRILPRYTTSAPRYTSYPTAPVWSESYGRDEFRADLATCTGSGLSLYVHVPFCRSLCHFCACNRVITRDANLPEVYLDTLEREIETIRDCVDAPPAATQQHWGGGTPTHLTPAQIRRLFGALTGAFPMDHGAEISIEVDPRVTTAEHVEALAECGFNRMSLGVQDFDPHVQETIHRIQTSAQTAELVARARASGFRGVGCDLIYGLPYQTVASFMQTLDTVLAFRPDRLAIYAYAHVTWVAKQQRGFERADLPSPETRSEILISTIERLLAAGYVHVGMDHFATPEDELARALADGTLRRNFRGYTTQAGTQLIGFGPSAISELEPGFAQSQRDLKAWESSVHEHGLATMRGHRLSADDRARRFVIARIMCQGRVRASEYESEFGEPFAARFAPELASLAPLEDDGLVVVGDGVELTPLGRLLVRNVASSFDAYLPEQLQTAEPRFSRTV